MIISFPETTTDTVLFCEASSNHVKIYLYGFVCIHNDGYEDAKHYVYEKTDEQVEIYSTVPPYVTVLVADD